MLHTKALYNLLRFNVQEDPSIPHEPWAVEDLRALSLGDLFVRLEKMGLSLQREQFIQFAENSDTPEHLAEIFWGDREMDAAFDPFYLLIFELWRRLVPQKPALSILCDELDQLIEAYDRTQLESDEPIQDALANLLDVLEENSDLGGKPQDIFSHIEDHCAHDIESFLYDYISDLLASNRIYASELIEDFKPFVPEPIWFEILEAKLLSYTDIHEANERFARILQRKVDLEILLQVLQCLSTAGDRALFALGTKRALALLESEEDFQEILSLIAQYYHLLDEEKAEQEALHLLEQRKGTTGPLDPHDPAVKAISKLLS